MEVVVTVAVGVAEEEEEATIKIVLTEAWATSLEAATTSNILPLRTTTSKT